MKGLRFAALGAALAFFFDPQNGARRRAALRERLSALARRGRERLEQPEMSEELVNKAQSVQAAQDAEAAQPVAGE